MILENVSKRYGDRVALDGISLEIGDGSITAVLGESGAGKSTLLNVIAGMTDCEGRVSGVGRVSYLFQSAKLLPHLTAEENLKFVLPKSEWERAPEMLGRVGLAGREKSLPATLSGGERQRVAIARAFLYPHEVLVMDEPFSSLDLALKESLIGLVYEMWRERGETVVFVTHDVREAAVLSHRAVVLRKGRIVGDICPDSPLPRDFFKPSPVEEALVRALVERDG